MTDRRHADSDRLLQDVLDFPFPSGLRAAPLGGLVAWVCNEAGARNVWVADTAGGETGDARRLTRYRGDDGHAIGQLRWSHAGDTVIYVRGMQLADGPPPNPAHAPAGMAASEIWLAGARDERSRRIGSGHSPEVSPADNGLAWIRDGQVWLADVDGGRDPALLIHDRGRCSDLAWSPDGTCLAFVSDRGNHSLVGICDVAARTLRWLAPGVDRDVAPAWSPDGERVAFIRLAESPSPTYLARPAGAPWSVWTADVRTGEGRCAWRADAGPGSVFTPLACGPQLLWAPSGQVVFPWEGSGWLHLHAIEPGVAMAVDLTPGPFEVSAVALDAGAVALVCATNKDAIDGSRLWRIDLATRAMSPLTDADRLAVAPGVCGNGRVVALQSDARTPLQPVRIGEDGTVHSLAPRIAPREFSPESLVLPQAVAFTSPDGQEIRAQLFVPDDAPRVSRRPAIVHFHGGPSRQMFAAWHPMECYHLQYGLNQALARRGYVVLSVNYRGGSGYGLRFREPEGLGAGGASEFQDVLGSAQFLRARADVDPRRIGVYGISYGGLMAALALSRASALFAAGVDCAGISNWRPAFADAPADVQEAAARSSPLAASAQWRSPVLFIHADDDRVVPFDQTIEMVQAMRRQSEAEVECLVLPDEQHDFLRRDSWARAFEATAEFFDRRLGLAAPAVSSMEASL